MCNSDMHLPPSPWSLRRQSKLQRYIVSKTISIPKHACYFSCRCYLRSTWHTAHCVFWCGFTAKPISIQKSRWVIDTQSLLVASAHSTESFYPLTSLHTIVCLHIEWFFNMYYLKHLKKKTTNSLFIREKKEHQQIF